MTQGTPDMDGPKWYQLNAAQWVTVGTVVFGAIVSLTLFQEQLANHEKAITAFEKRLGDLDTVGTQASRMTLQRDNQMITSLDQRMQKLESVSIEIKLLAQTVDTIRTDIKDVKSDLKEVKERPNNYTSPTR